MTTIRMPQLGETIVEGTILKWLKKEGETVERDEPLFEISTDKVDTEVPSSVGGTVTKILVEEGQTVPVGTDLAEVSEDGAGGGDASGESAAAAGAAASGAAASPTAPKPRHQKQRAPRRSPKGRRPRCPRWSRRPRRRPTATAASATAPTARRRVRRPARPGTAVADPVPARAPARRRARPRPVADRGIRHGWSHHEEGRPRGHRRWWRGRRAGHRRGPGRGTRPGGGRGPGSGPGAPAVEGVGDEVVPVSHIRKLIGQHMVASLQTSARAWTMVEVNVDHLVKLRERAKESFKAKHGVNLTYLPFVIRATCDALMAHPEVNSSLRGDEIVRHRAVHMGIAVSYDEGLIVPVIKGADSMNTRRAGARDRRPRGAGARPPAEARRDPGLDVHDHEPGAVRLGRERPDHQPAQHRDPVPRRDPEARRRDRGHDRDPLDGEHLDVVGPPHDRRRDRHAVPRSRQAEPRELGLRRGRHGLTAAR